MINLIINVRTGRLQPEADNRHTVTPLARSVNGPVKPVKVYKGSTQQPSPASLSGHQATAVTELPDSCPRVISAKSRSRGGYSRSNINVCFRRTLSHATLYHMLCIRQDAGLGVSGWRTV